MILKSTSGLIVLVPKHVRRLMETFVEGPEARAEAGGILIGCYRGTDVEIIDCTVPRSEDSRWRYFFARKSRGHARKALAAWSRSSHVETYVGEWHTHPEDDPTPSSVDRRTWAQTVRRSTGDPLVFMIAGRTSTFAEIAWRDRKERLTIIYE